jgi:biotin carboxyl carrier protein
MRYVVTWKDREIEVELEPRDDGRFNIDVGGQSHIADIRRAGSASLYSLLVDERTLEVTVVGGAEETRVCALGRDLTLQVESEQERDARLVEAAHGPAGPHTVKSVMPGIVSRIMIREGEEVELGTPMLILEAMKMENEIRSPTTGTVKRLLVAEGDTVNGGTPLVSIE